MKKTNVIVDNQIYTVKGMSTLLNGTSVWVRSVFNRNGIKKS